MPGSRVDALEEAEDQASAMSRLLSELRRSRETERSLVAIYQLAAETESLDDLLAGIGATLRGLSWVAPNLGASVVLAPPELTAPSFGCPNCAPGLIPPCFASGELRVEEHVTDVERRDCPAARTRCRVPIRGVDGRIEGTVHVCLADGAFVPDAIRFLEAVALVVAKTLRRRRAEARFLEAQKLEALGRLAGGIAHDFNNLLAVILSTGACLRDELPEGARAREDLDDILDAARRGAALTRQLLTFSRRGEIRDAVVEPAKTLAELEKLLRRTLGARIRLVVDVDPAAGPVRLDGGHLEQVVMNLAVNARDAMPDGGTLRIELRGEVLPAANGELPPGRYVRLSVADTGPGIPAEALPRLFEPFFSTKTDSGGTGLGLATVHEIVRRAGGHVFVASAPGEGARFDLRFPAAEAAAPAGIALPVLAAG